MSKIITATRVETYRWDAAVDAKTTGAKVLRGPVLPSGALVTSGILLVDAALAGGTVTDTVSLGTGEAATDVQSALARNNALWSSPGARLVTLTPSAAPVLTTQDRAPTFTINGTGLTGGAFRLVLHIMEVV